MLRLKKADTTEVGPNLLPNWCDVAGGRVDPRAASADQVHKSHLRSLPLPAPPPLLFTPLLFRLSTPTLFKVIFISISSVNYGSYCCPFSVKVCNSPVSVDLPRVLRLNFRLFPTWRSTAHGVEVEKCSTLERKGWSSSVVEKTAGTLTLKK